MAVMKLDEDIKVFFVTANSFPEGINEAIEKLHAIVPISANRKLFGISRPENGPIVYKAAAEEIFEGEAEILGCETMVVKSGAYTSITVHNYPDDIQRISRAFDELLKEPGLDPSGYCVEWYVSDKAVICMIRLED